MIGAGAALLTDNLFFCRYRHKDSDEKETDSWSDWTGAANSRPPKEGEDPSETFQAQLAEGWVKRVMNGLNPFEARINDFYSSDSPATYTSMIRQAGPRFEGAVAFNPDKDVIENVGLIELYQTVLNRAEDLSINLAQAEGSSGVYTALLLAASRIAGFYTLLGNKAYTDALDPTIGFGTDSVEYGSLAPTIFTFMNQVPTLLDEAGREIVNLTYRSKYVEDPDGQWQGYTYQKRAWGLEGWGRRTATGALFDWAVANAILPSSVAFKLTQADMNRLERDGVRLIVRNELFHIQDQGYRTEDEFMTDVRKAMDKAVEKAESTGDPITEEKALEYGALVLDIADNNGVRHGLGFQQGTGDRIPHECWKIQLPGSRGLGNAPFARRNPSGTDRTGQGRGWPSALNGGLCRADGRYSDCD